MWRRDVVSEGNVSDPYLMTGFDKKVLHVIVNNDCGTIDVTLQADITGGAGEKFFCFLNIISNIFIVCDVFSLI